jgi:tRNA (guanine-N7-)-methyltransferase
MSETDYPRRHFGRRKGWKLRARQSGLVETLLPHLLIEPKPGLDPHAYFALNSPPPCGEAEARSASASPQGGGEEAVVPPRDVWLEIGFGGGEHLAAQAEANPDIGIIGAEPFVAGLAKLLGKIEDQGLTNIRLYPEDARDVLNALPDKSLGKIFILFPDPWPKTRHHKRRFIQMEMLDELARVMREGAELRFASDAGDYVSWALERFLAHPEFEWTANGPDDWNARPEDWIETRYEAKALKAGRRPAYLRFLRK